MKIQYIFSVILIVALSSCRENDMLTSDNLKSGEIQLESIANKTTVNQYVPNSILDNPIIVWQAEAQPISSWPAIFYSPHQDDETLGMGASIAEHVRAGRAVYVVLLSNGANSGMLTYIQQNYNPNATMQDVINARNNEFIAACIALGVHRVYITHVGVGYDESADFLF
ncbi:MAG: PIG-L family deacetylase [Ignavibacteriaceae bacterium]